MNAVFDPRLIGRLRRTSEFAGGVTVLLGGLVLAGWALDIEWLKSIMHGSVAMNPGGTAVGFMLAGGALLLLEANRSARWMAPLGRGLGAVVALLAAVRLAGYFFGFDEGTDRMLFARGAVRVLRPGQQRERQRHHQRQHHQQVLEPVHGRSFLR